MRVGFLLMQYVPLLFGQPWIVHFHRGRRAMLLYVAVSASVSLCPHPLLVGTGTVPSAPFAAPASAAAPSYISAAAATLAVAATAASRAESAAACVAPIIARRRAAHAPASSSISRVAAGHTVAVVTA
jgi:hypothetical protein